METNMETNEIVSGRPFCIVEFPDERDEDGTTAMAIVSYKWIINEEGTCYCKWPTNLRSELQRLKLVKDHVDLNDKQTYQLCPVIVKYKAASFEKASAKFDALQQLSSVSSETDTGTQCPQMRNKKRNVCEDYCYSDTSEDEPYVPSVPKLKKNKSRVAPQDELRTNLLNKNSSAYAMKINDGNNEGLRTFVPTPTVHSAPSTPSLSSVSSRYSHEDSVLLTKMATKIELISNDIKFIMRSIQLQGNDTVSAVTQNEFVQGLPAESERELTEFNLLLQDEQAMVSVCSYFALIGGQDVVDCTRKLLSKILSHELALKCSWSGRVNKFKFSTLDNIMKLIIGVVRKNPLSRNATHSEIEKIVKTWLRNAGDRDGGRNKRRTK